MEEALDRLAERMERGFAEAADRRQLREKIRDLKGEPGTLGSAGAGQESGGDPERGRQRNHQRSSGLFLRLKPRLRWEAFIALLRQA